MLAFVFFLGPNDRLLLLFEKNMGGYRVQIRLNIGSADAVLVRKHLDRCCKYFEWVSRSAPYFNSLDKLLVFFEGYLRCILLGVVDGEDLRVAPSALQLQQDKPAGCDLVDVLLTDVENK